MSETLYLVCMICIECMFISTLSLIFN